MKKWNFLIPAQVMVLILIFAAFVAYGKDFEIKQKAGGYAFEIKIDRNPPIVGDNHIEIGLNDKSGTPIRNAEVLVNYYMPPMPRMAPMNYTTTAELKGKKYKATLNFIMAGPWIIRIIVTHEGKRAAAKFNVDAQ